MPSLELQRFLPELGRISNFSKASTFAFFLLCELLYFEFFHAYMKMCPSRALGILNSPKSSSTSAFLAAIAPCTESTTPPELILESPRDSSTSTPLQSLHTHKVLSLLSFSNTQISKEINPSSFLLQMENLDALLTILCSSNLLLSLSGCSTTL
jgi:hypothetical protein